MSRSRPSLSVVVVFYDMRREAPRTLHSLSRGYQRGVDDLDYEVLALDNGSSAPLDEDMVRSHGPEFSYHRLDLEMNRKFELKKTLWDTVSGRVHTAGFFFSTPA